MLAGLGQPPAPGRSRQPNTRASPRLGGARRRARRVVQPTSRRARPEARRRRRFWPPRTAPCHAGMALPRPCERCCAARQSTRHLAVVPVASPDAPRAKASTSGAGSVAAAGFGPTPARPATRPSRRQDSASTTMRARPKPAELAHVDSPDPQVGACGTRSSAVEDRAGGGAGRSWRRGAATAGAVDVQRIILRFA